MRVHVYFCVFYFLYFAVFFSVRTRHVSTLHKFVSKYSAQSGDCINEGNVGWR